MLSDVLRKDLLTLAVAYTKATKTTLGAISGRAYGTHMFFEELAQDKRSVTVRKLDEMLTWFVTKWPEDTPRPPLDPWVEKNISVKIGAKRRRIAL